MLDLQLKDEQEAGYTYVPRKKVRRKLTKLERMRLLIIAHMREQRKAVTRWAKEQKHLPLSFPDWDHFKLGALRMSERMTPVISAIWDHEGTRFATRVGLDPDEWSVTNPHTADRIERASLAFCKETNATTSTDLQAALDRLRIQLHEGVVNEGESVEQLTKRVQAVFDTATKSRARTIAQTETSRAVHAAQDDAARRSGVVTGWRWQLSSDACPVCVAIAARHPVARLGEPFAVIGKNPHYSHIYMPPAHPRCNCTAQPVLDTDEQPNYIGGPLIDPKPSTDEELQSIRQQRQERDEAILRGSEAWGAAPYAERYPIKPKPTVVKLPQIRKPWRGDEPWAAQPAKSFDEGKHPRDDRGEFTSGGSSKKPHKMTKKEKADRVAKGKPLEYVSEKARRAAETQQKTDGVVQEYTKQNEFNFAKRVNGKAFPNNGPTDVEIEGGGVNGRVAGLEIKTMVAGKNDRVNMKPDALARKYAWERKNNSQMSTVIMDHRDKFGGGENAKLHSGHEIYYKRGLGNLRLGSMYKCKDVSELKILLKTPYKKLPPAAQGDTRGRKT